MTKKRFIAGAVCPRCNTQDSIRAVNDTERSLLLRDCVECGFTDQLSTLVNQPREMGTRVTPVTTVESKPMPIKLIGTK